MLNIILIAIGILSIGVVISGDIKAYAMGNYNPYIFRMKEGYEWKLVYTICYFGYFMPIIFVQDIYLKNVYIAILVVSTYLSMFVLNYKCFKSNRDKRILIENLIMTTLYIGVVYLVYKRTIWFMM